MSRTYATDKTFKNPGSYVMRIAIAAFVISASMLSNVSLADRIIFRPLKQDVQEPQSTSNSAAATTQNVTVPKVSSWARPL